MPSIKQVAEKAGVSIATVSHVLNNTRTVRTHTRQRVLVAVKELGYTQNAAARGLAIGRSEMLGVLISDARNPFFPEITTAFQELALMHEVDALVMSTHSDPHRTLSSIKRFLGLNVPGIAVLTSRIDGSVREMLAQRRVCGVYLDAPESGPYITTIRIDYGAGIAQAVDHLAQLGHQRVGYIGISPPTDSEHRRREAFLQQASSHHMTAQCLESELTVEGGYFACAKLLVGGAPTAIFASADVMAIGALHCIHDRGLKSPEDISVIGIGNIAFAEYTHPSLTTVAIPRERIGKTAFESLWKLITDESHTGEEIEIETNLIARQSTGPAKT